MTAPTRLLTCASAALLLFASSARAAEITVPGDFATLQAAIDAAVPGDSVVVQPGRYQGQIRIAAGVALRSAGDGKAGKIGLARAEATILDAGGKGTAVVIDEGASLDGFTVTGAGKFDQEEFDLHFEQRGENLPDERGVVGGGGGPDAAVSISAAAVRVSNCLVHDNGLPGIGVSGDGSRAEVLGNHVYRNMGGGIAFGAGASGRAAGNRCSQNLRAGIGCRGGAWPTIEDNHCFGNVRAGVGIREGATPLVAGNQCYENRRAGIGVRMAGTEPILRGNRCYENGMAGIGCRDGAAPLIVGNECFRNRLAGIGATGNARPAIIGNKLHGNEAAAIGLDACESGEALIRDNEITAKSLVCIGIQRGWAVELTGNQITREGGMPPLVMVFEGAAAEFTGNHFVGSGVAAIRSQGQIFVCENQFDCPAPRKGGPPQQAVWALPGSMLSMSDDNQIRGWRAAENPAVRVADRDALEGALRDAQAGTTILLAPGEYAGGLSVRDLRGAAGKPIVVAAAIRQRPPVIVGGNAGLHLTDPSHLELRNLVIRGARENGLNIDDGGSFETPAEFLKLSGLVVRDIGGEGNRDGIKLSGVKHFRVDACTVERWGSGGSAIDMVGCHDGVVADSAFVHGADATAANGVQAKGGSHGIAIRRCRFADAGGRGVNLGGSTGAEYFRPADAPAEASGLLVEDCLFEGSMAAVAFVGASGATVRRNTILRPRRWVLRILQENTDPKLARCGGGRFERNSVAFRSDELNTAANVGAETAAHTFQFAGNAWTCIDKPSESQRLIRLPVAETGATYPDPRDGGFDEERFKREIDPHAGSRFLPLRR